ncbi:CCL4 protein, partial [Dryoscopus gambensis]|nr:CCL4 protein [Dryoscopus gambensis]
MKVLAATLVTLLLLATCSPSECVDAVPTTCCISYQRKPIPRRLVSSVLLTSSTCIKPGVIVRTKKAKEVCADPEAPWVKELRKHFQSPEN